MPKEISDVTGSGYGLVLDKLNIVENKEIDLNQYVENQNKLVLKFSNVAGTLCCLEKDMSQHPYRIKKNKNKLNFYSV